jgi:hypothetical protein
MEERGVWPEEKAFRLRQIAGELVKYSRFTEEELRTKVALRIYEMEEQLVAGQESEARYYLLQNGHYRAPM